jgi:hypothetical protein
VTRCIHVEYCGTGYEPACGATVVAGTPLCVYHLRREIGSRLRDQPRLEAQLARVRAELQAWEEALETHDACTLRMKPDE